MTVCHAHRGDHGVVGKNGGGQLQGNGLEKDITFRMPPIALELQMKIGDCGEGQTLCFGLYAFP